MAADVRTPSWGDIAEAVAARLGLDTLRSPTLKTVIERGARFVAVDPKMREIILDGRALFIGFLAAGQQDRDSLQYGNTASWFVAWLSTRVDPQAIARALTAEQTAPEEAFPALQAGYAVILSQSVLRAVDTAQSLSSQTIGRPESRVSHSRMRWRRSSGSGKSRYSVRECIAV